MDLSKAFDAVKFEVLWKIVRQFGCLERFTQMVRQPRDGMMVRVTYNGVFSEASKVTDGVRQDRVFTPTHFTLICSAMLMTAYHGERPVIRVAGRTDGQLLNQRRMNFQSCVSTNTAHELLFAAACDNFGLLQLQALENVNVPGEHPPLATPKAPIK
ncbi:hypothetical protein SprV_0602210200 [Sparganum proliferum]